MHGLHDVDQNDTIIGLPDSTRVFVSNDSPLEFSTFTEGTCAKASVEINSEIAKTIAFIPIDNIWAKVKNNIF